MDDKKITKHKPLDCVSFVSFVVRYSLEFD